MQRSRVSSIDRVEIFVPDRYEAAGWYESVLGLEVVTELEGRAVQGGPLMISADDGRTMLALFEGEARGSRRTADYPVVTFRADGPFFLKFLEGTQRARVYDEEGRESPFGRLVDHETAYSVYFCDPYGNRYELTTRDHDEVAEVATRLAASSNPTEAEEPEAEEQSGWRATLRSWLTKLLTLRGLIATIVFGMMVTVVFTSAWSEAWQAFETWNSERQNISKDEAIAEAKEYVGASTVDVIPFRNADSNEQYIAVITGPPKSKTLPKNPYLEVRQEGYEFYLSEETQCAYTKQQPLRQCYPIKILQKTEGASPEVVDLGLAAYDSAFDKYNDDGKLVGDRTPETEYRNSLVGVVDIDDDGNKEVYSMYRSTSAAGTGSYLVKIKLYDSLTGETYELKGSEEVTSTTINPHFIGKRPGEEFATWMKERADTLNLFNLRNDAVSQETREWIRNNGVGFDEGQPKIEEYEGQIPDSLGSTACTIDDGEFEWRSYFKGPLFSYDLTRDTHYAVWVPESNYDWADRIVAGKQYLWLDVIKDDGLLAFDKETKALVVIPIAELKGRQPGTVRNSGFGGLRVEGSSLYVWHTQTSFDGQLLPLTLPDTIDAEEEFENAAGCRPRPYAPSNVVKNEAWS